MKQPIMIRMALLLAMITGSLSTLYAQPGRYKRLSTDSTDKGDPLTDEAAAIFDSAGQNSRPYVLGLNFAVSIGNTTLIDLSPLVGYKIKPHIVAGVGGTYIYYRSQVPVYSTMTGAFLGSYTLKTSMYGARVFAQYYITKGLFAHAEHELLNTEYIDGATGLNLRTWINNPFVGAGLRTQLTRRAWISAMLLYNLNFPNNELYSPYPYPLVYRVGLMWW